MKCPVAAEWMHRYLDHDLNEVESELLINHIATCKDCTELFSRMKRLSDQLEHLPNKTPKYSLVDAVLPQLDAIDRARKEEGSALEQYSDYRPPLMRSIPKDRRRRRSAWREWRSGRVMGGIAAAGLILVVAIWSHNPQTVPEAEMTDGSANNAIDKSTNDLAFNESSSVEDSPALEGNIEDKPLTTQAQKDLVLPDQPIAKSTDEPTVGATDASTKDASATKESPDNGKNSAKTDIKTPNSNNEPNQDSKANQMQITSELTDGGNKGEGVSSSDASQESESLPTDDGVMISSIPDSSEVTNTTENTRRKTLSATSEWVSPDGKYVSVFDKNSVSIYKYNDQDRTLLQSAKVEGTFVKGEWNTDNKSFTYVTENNSESALFSIEVVDSSSSP